MNLATTIMSKNIDLNEQFLKAFDLLENSDKNIFITGKAGTGKSTLLDYFRSHTKKNVVVLAPTGVAALNVRGQTIHSFFKFKTNITLDAVKKKKTIKNSSLYKNINIIIIDEVSMVRADLLDCVDAFLRRHGNNRNLPFGGIQMVFIGDLYQLPPVVTADEREIFTEHYKSPYFFDAQIFNQTQLTIEKTAPFNMELVELDKIYRQKDDKFVALLNTIRNNSATAEDIAVLNERCLPDAKQTKKDFYITLTTTNRLADEINQQYLSKLSNEILFYNGLIAGTFDEKYLPTQVDLQLKISAQIMFLNNDSNGGWVNGTIGKIISRQKCADEPDKILVEILGGKTVEVSPYTWEISNVSYNDRTGSLETETIGSFRQYPLKLAWAVTIHKSQGKTFDRVIIDLGRGTFAHGQLYVALSRATSLEGIILKKPISKAHILTDQRIVKFMTQYQYRLSEERCGLDKKVSIIEETIRNSGTLKITYLKSNDEKTFRLIRPIKVGEMEYKGKTYVGVYGYCFERKEERIFRVDRILEMAAYEIKNELAEAI